MVGGEIHSMAGGELLQKVGTACGRSNPHMLGNHDISSTMRNAAPKDAMNGSWDTGAHFTHPAAYSLSRVNYRYQAGLVLVEPRGLMKKLSRINLILPGTED
jgi:hypothetical protein